MTEAGEAKVRGTNHGWRIGSMFGAPIYIAPSWPIIALVIVAAFGPVLDVPWRPAWYGYVVAFGYAVLLLLSVLVHEGAHAAAAQRFGHPVQRIVADVWGGHTVYDAARAKPMPTALIALSGPLSNLALAGIGALVLSTTEGPGSGTAADLLAAFTRANLFVGLFNLLPGLPLDGGQVVSSLVWRFTGRKGAGFTVAGWTGRVVAVLAIFWFAIWPLMQGRRLQDMTFSLVIALMVGLFMWRGASQAVAAGPLIDATSAPVTDLLEPVSLVPGDRSIADHVRSAHAGSGPGFIAVTDPSGWPFGLIDPAAVASVPAHDLVSTPALALAAAMPPEWVVAVAADASLTDLLRAMGTDELSAILVLDAADRRPMGIVTAERINSFVQARLRH